MAAAIPLSVPTLTDGVVQLRAFSADDAPALAVIWTDPAIRARKWVKHAAARAGAGEAWEWAIVDATSGELAGRRALKEIDWEQRRAVAASWLDPRHRGKRFAARSLRLAAAHAFAHGIVRLHAECDVDNEASFRSLLAAGMRYEGTLRSYLMSPAGVPIDQHVLGMLPQDLADAPALDVSGVASRA